MRPSQRRPDELRTIEFTRHYTKHAEGSVLVSFGDTRVLCNASVQIGSIPKFLKNTGTGWLTAEYSMLPRATKERTEREAARGKQSGRTLEIQRLIGRTLRSCMDLKAIGENSIFVDCDVLQADGGTRTAAITGACIALYDAALFLKKEAKLSQMPFKKCIAAISVGIHQGMPVLDLDYAEDHDAETDMNIVMDEYGHFIEIQGTAENGSFSKETLMEMTSLAEKGIQTLITQQKNCLNI